MRHSAHIEMNSSLQEPIRQEQRQENKRMGLFSNISNSESSHLPIRYRAFDSYRQYIAIKVIAYCR